MLLFCQLPILSAGWLPVVGVGIVLSGALILASAAWNAISSDKQGGKNSRSTGFLEELSKRVFRRVGPASAAHSSPGTTQKTEGHFGKRAKQVVVLNRKRERAGLVVGVWLFLIGFLLIFIGWPCP